MAAIIVIAPFIIYLIYFHDGISADQNDWSSFGSFYGGIVSSILSFISIVLLVYTISIQKKKDYSDNITALEKDTEDRVFKYIEKTNVVFDNLKKFIDENVIDYNGNRLYYINYIKEFDDLSKLINLNDLEKSDAEIKAEMVDKAYSIVMRSAIFFRKYSEYFYLCFGLFLRINKLPENSLSRGMLQSITCDYFDEEKRKLLNICLLQQWYLKKEIYDDEAQVVGIRLKYYNNIWDLYKKYSEWNDGRSKNYLEMYIKK